MLTHHSGFFSPISFGKGTRKYDLGKAIYCRLRLLYAVWCWLKVILPAPSSVTWKSICVLLESFFNIYFNKCIYLAALVLSCGMWDLESLLQCVESFSCFMRDLLPQPGMELGPLHWERRVLATGPPGESLFWNLYGPADICLAPLWKCGAYHGGREPGREEGCQKAAVVIVLLRWRLTLAQAAAHQSKGCSERGRLPGCLPRGHPAWHALPGWLSQRQGSASQHCRLSYSSWGRVSCSWGGRWMDTQNTSC